MKRLTPRREHNPVPWEIDPEDDLQFSERFDAEEDRPWFAPQATRDNRAGRRRNAARRRRQADRWELDEGNW